MANEGREALILKRVYPNKSARPHTYAVLSHLGALDSMKALGVNIIRDNGAVGQGHSMQVVVDCVGDGHSFDLVLATSEPTGSRSFVKSDFGPVPKSADRGASLAFLAIASELLWLDPGGRVEAWITREVGREGVGVEEEEEKAQHRIYRFGVKRSGSDERIQRWIWGGNRVG